MLLPFRPIVTYEDFMLISEETINNNEAFHTLKAAVDDALNQIQNTEKDITEMDFQIIGKSKILQKLMTLALPFAIEHDEEAALIANIFDLVSVGDDGNLVLDFSFNFVDGCLANWAQN